jgi:hypothetical protein
MRLSSGTWIKQVQSEAAAAIAAALPMDNYGAGGEGVVDEDRPVPGWFHRAVLGMIRHGHLPTLTTSDP